MWNFKNAFLVMLQYHRLMVMENPNPLPDIRGKIKKKAFTLNQAVRLLMDKNER